MLYLSSVLVLVSSDDSLNAVALEGIKAGLPIICSNMSGFPEIVEEGLNGFMTEPKWQFFDKECKPNPKVWNHRKKTIYSEESSERIVDFIYDKIRNLENDRNALLNKSLASYQKSKENPFSEEAIAERWNGLFEDLDRGQN